jgi:hypothetical protein
MKALYATAILIAISLMATPVSASGITAAQMFEDCSSGPDGEAYRLCQGYMAGYAQAAFGLMSLDKSKELCLPDYFAGNELLPIFLRMMKSTPKESKVWNAPIGPLLMVILTTNFPCK